MARAVSARTAPGGANGATHAPQRRPDSRKPRTSVNAPGAMHRLSAAAALDCRNGVGGLFMVIAAALLLLAGFAGGYGVRELVSRRRWAAAERRYLERQAKRKAAARSVIEELASAVGARTKNQQPIH
jgi:hypothetical protein